LTGIDGQESLGTCRVSGTDPVEAGKASKAKKKQGQKPCFQSIA
jgi:hypothetical protein